MDQWDPMKEAYENRNFNCYNQGVGRDLSGSSRNNKEVTLLVQGIPPNLGKIGFLNLFLEYGKVIKHTLITNAEHARGLHGYITYETNVDAEAAMSHLHQKVLGQYTLRVFSALTDEERNKRRKQKQDEEMLQSYIRRDAAERASDAASVSSSSHSLHVEDRSHQLMEDRSHQLMENRSHKYINESSSHLQNSGLKLDSRSQYQQPRGVGRGNMFQGSEIDDDRNHSLHSMEREAYSHYSSQENLAYQQKRLPRYHNSSVKEHYQDDHDIVKNSNMIIPPRGPKARGICVYCYRGGCVNVCSSCKMPYCSNVCQKMDWPRHKEICITLREYYGNDADLSSIPHGTVSRMHNSNSCYFDDDDVESSHSQEPMTHRNDRSHSNNTMFEAKGQETRHFRECHNGRSSTSNEHVDRYRGPSASAEHVDRYCGPSINTGHDRYPGPSNSTEHANRYHGRATSTEHSDYYRGPSTNTGHMDRSPRHSASNEYVDHSLNAAKAQNFASGMIKNNINRTEYQSGQKAKTALLDGPGQSQIISSNINMRNVPRNHEDGSYRRQEDRATPVSQKDFRPANNRNNSNSGNFETKEAFSRTNAVPLSQETRVKDIGGPVKAKGDENVTNKAGNQDVQSKQEEKSTTLSQQKLNVKSEEGRSTGTKAAVVEANEKLPSAVELTLAVKTSGQGFLTYFESPYKFWISLQDYLEVFTESTQIMGQAISENGNTPPVVCKVGATYGVMFMGEWCRVTVTSITGSDINVFFIDYGNQETVKQEDLRILTVEMLQLPAQAVCCCVSKLKPKGSDSWSEAASAAVQQWLGEPMSTFLEFEVVAKKGSVHAVNISHNEKTMSNVLLAGGFAEKVDIEPGLPNLTNTPARLMANSLKRRMDEVKIGDKITGDFTDFTSSDRFIVVDVKSTHLLGELTSALQSEYKNNTVSYKPVQGELVAAKFSVDGNWYRAEVTNIDGDKYTLYFVDYGNSEVQKVENIRSLTNKILVETPRQALVCSLFTAQSLSGYSSKIFNEELKKLLGTAVNSKGYVSVIVKGKTNEALLVDIDKAGKSLSDELFHKLSSQTQKTPSDRSVDTEHSVTKANKPSSSPSKTVLENVAKLSDLGTETLAMESGKTISVLVSVFECPTEFYVQLSSKNGLFIAMMKQLDRSVISSPRLSAPTVGNLTAAMFSENRIWCRGVIEKIEGKKCLVRFFDYGNSEEKLLTTLKELPASVCHLPAQAIRCSLGGRLQTSAASDKKLKDIMERSSVDVKVCGNDSGVFSVQVFQNGIDICAAVVDSCSQHTSAAEPISAVKNPKVTSDIVMETLPATGEPVKAVVTHIDSFSRLFIACNDVTELMIQLYKSASSLPILSNPAVGSLCAAQYSLDSTWYRARIVGIKSPKTCIVQFLDYGNSEETSMVDLRELDSDMSKLPGQAICCCLFGYESELGSRPVSNATELINKLRLELLEKSVIVRAVDRKADTWIVKLENEHGECINTKFKPACLSLAMTPKLSDVTFEYPADTEFEAIFLHINSLSDFYCQMFDTEKLTEVDSLSELLREDVSNLGKDILLDPVVNGVYISQYMGTWYRCVVEEVRNTKVLIKYIDYGNSEEVPASQLRPLNPERLQIPVRLLRCKLYGVTPVHENWNNTSMPDYLAILRTNKVHLVIESRDTDVFHVSVILQDGEKVNVATDLVNIGMAKFLQVVSPQKDESRSMMPDLQKPSQQDDDDGDASIDVDDLRRKIRELQMLVEMSEQKKKQK